MRFRRNIFIDNSDRLGAEDIEQVTNYLNLESTDDYIFRGIDASNIALINLTLDPI